MLGSTQKLVPLLGLCRPERTISQRRVQSPLQRSSLGRHRRKCFMQLRHSWSERLQPMAPATRLHASKLWPRSTKCLVGSLLLKFCQGTCRRSTT